MATWAKCPDLFLYTKGKDVYLWRCNETTWMPMNTADFDDLGKVMDHVDLIGGNDSLLEWEKSSYIDLVAYISSRRLLVNSRGLVIAELHEFDQDGKVEENGLPIYIRSLDVLSLKPFGLRDRSIPSRTVRYLETEGKAVPVEDSTTTTTSSSTELDEGKRRADLEKQVEELKAANKTLKSDKEAAEKQANDLKDRNKSLADDVKAQKTAAEKAQQERDAAKRDKEAAERKAAVAEKEATELKETNKTLKSGKEAAEKKITKLKETNKTLDKQVKDLQDQIKSLTPKEPVWMNDLNIPEDNNNMGFVSLDELDWNNNHDMALHGSQGSFTTEDDTTNVRASYFFKLASAYLNEVYTWIGIDFDSLPKKEMARFIPTYWSVGYHNGYPYVVKLISRHKVATGEITFSLVP